MMSDALPIACDMRALSERERKAQTAASIRLIVQERTELIELPNGYALSFSTAPGRLVALSKWIERESLCCPWIDFALLRPAAGTVQLRLTSSDPDAKAMIAAGLQLAANLAEGAAASPELALPTRPLDVSDFERISASGVGKACSCK